MSTFTVPATVAHSARPDRRVTLDLFVDTGATWTLLPAEIVAQLGLETPRQRSVELASGERVTYPLGQVAMQLDGEQLVTIFLAAPPGCQPLLGAVTLEAFGLSVDPVRKRLVAVPGFLL
jgi:clan AA aspartic protease